MVESRDAQLVTPPTRVEAMSWRRAWSVNPSCHLSKKLNTRRTHSSTSNHSYLKLVLVILILRIVGPIHRCVQRVAGNNQNLSADRKGDFVYVEQRLCVGRLIARQIGRVSQRGPIGVVRETGPTTCQLLGADRATRLADLGLDAQRLRALSDGRRGPGPRSDGRRGVVRFRNPKSFGSG